MESAVAAAVIFTLQTNVALQNAELGVLLGLEVHTSANRGGVAVLISSGYRRIRYNRSTSCGAKGPATRIKLSVMFVCVDAQTCVTADPQADFRARDVEVSGAECVADAYIFDGFRLSCDDRVGRRCTGDCEHGRSGAEKKALDFHN